MRILVSEGKHRNESNDMKDEQCEQDIKMQISDGKREKNCGNDIACNDKRVKD